MLLNVHLAVTSSLNYFAQLRVLYKGGTPAPLPYCIVMYLVCLLTRNNSWSTLIALALPDDLLYLVYFVIKRASQQAWRIMGHMAQNKASLPIKSSRVPVTAQQSAQVAMAALSV